MKFFESQNLNSNLIIQFVHFEFEFEYEISKIQCQNCLQLLEQMINDPKFEDSKLAPLAQCENGREKGNSQVTRNSLSHKI
jgi:hypothetical protein